MLEFLEGPVRLDLHLSRLVVEVGAWSCNAAVAGGSGGGGGACNVATSSLGGLASPGNTVFGTSAVSPNASISSLGAYVEGFPGGKGVLLMLVLRSLTTDCTAVEGALAVLEAMKS